LVKVPSVGFRLSTQDVLQMKRVQKTKSKQSEVGFLCLFVWRKKDDMLRRREGKRGDKGTYPLGSQMNEKSGTSDT
jgi:hypothetical protein